MSEHKRVLVVDDSKSARLVLRRMLEKHDLRVDTVESASLALDFLAHNRPDAIFMDHMMPGMDGFQAVKAIKANPRTATIPVMMYTSKGGDLYIGQARALGAVGVLPKTVAPAQLYESLCKIGIVKERREQPQQLDEDGASERAADIHPRRAPVSPPRYSEPGMAAPAADTVSAQLDQQLRGMLDEQRVELRKDILLSMETVARQSGARLHKELEDALSRLRAEGGSGKTAGRWPLAVLAAALSISLLANLYQSGGRTTTDSAAIGAQNDVLDGQADAQAATIADLKTEQDRSLGQLRASWDSTAWAMNQSLEYNYDEIALDDQRVDAIESLLQRLAASGFTGRLVVETHAGEFCLLGDQEKGFRLPPPELPVNQCEFIGNPVQAADTPAAQQSLRFANFVASTPLLNSGGITLEVTTLARTAPLFGYPEKSAATSALAWNQAAQANNRVSVSLAPAVATSDGAAP